MNSEQHSPIRVLLIEDDPNYAKTIRLVLSEAPGSNFRAEWAEGLAEGRQRLAEGQTDVVLLDLQLPDSTGLETFSRLHRNYPEVPIVVLTGAADDAVAIEAVRQGAQDYLVKGEANNALICRSLQYATERHRLTTMLAQANESRFRSAVVNNRDGILIVDEKGITRFANPAAHALFDRPELVGARFGFPMASDETTELEIVGPDGIVRAAEMRVAPTLWKGAPASLASLRDITDRAQALERERHLNVVLRTLRNVNQLIIREEDPDRLLRGACENLTETMRYPHAWIALLDDRGKLTAAAQSAANPAGAEALSGLLAGGELPRCVRQALASSGVVVTRETAAECPGCPLAGTYAGCAGQAVRLEFEGVVYGVIAVALPLTCLADPEQQDLFLELASDLAFGLRKIKLARQHREAERQIEELSRFPAENPHPVVRLSTSGEVLYANGAATAALAAAGVEPEGHVCEAWRARVRAAMAEGQPEEAEMPVGEAFFAATFAPVLEHGYVNVYLRDITKRRRAEQALRRSEQMLNETGKMAKIGGWEHDLITREAIWTRALYDIIEIEPGVVPGPDEHLDYYPPEDRARLEAAMERTIEKGVPFDLELRVHTSKGRLLWCRAFGEPVHEGGRCVKVRGTFQDITERKRAEETLRHNAKRLRADNEELERFNRAGIGRELRMIELKQEVDELCKQAGQPPRYPRAEGSVNTVDTVGTSS